MIRLLLSTLILTLFAAAAASAQPIDLPGKDKSHDDHTQQESGGLGRTGSRGGDKRGDAATDEGEEEVDDQGNKRRRKDRFD